jgi:hypothetical protein
MGGSSALRLLAISARLIIIGDIIVLSIKVDFM